ncbi:hypothetical protein P170DRAFT_465948 [Aspergillus steynii IBT 23096]|uniref:Zn(2)-C6 fungal-type domain-containing protein n=1 Tax=Aspergillus steynii IBT 23096 TaxID=1392250 RepID=A0A2I2G0L6_9EURO|nr:uncharacterized protein P170DRAFT_465948 [Aspergillus steynii IBT 23096]PLB46425.1 hypothetical protein P170DRAFT_465948 [Aspergillus steynii IBT 23096]
MIRPSVPARSGKKTNSLAFARTDCHTCLSTGQGCDRRRPQCTTCLERGVKCGGFVTPLSWDTSRTWLGESAGRDALAGRADAVGDKDVASSDHDGRRPSGSRRFRFVQSGRGGRKRRRIQQSTREISPSSAPVGSMQETSTLENREPVPVNDVEQISPGNTTQFDNYGPYLFDNIDFSIDQDVLSSLAAPNMTGIPTLAQTTLYPDSGLLAPPLESTLSGDQQGMNPDPSSIDGWVVSAPGVEPGRVPAPSAGIGNQHETLFRMYDSEFCVLPITSDSALNPFRCQQSVSEGSRLLFHSMLALCCRHLNLITGSWSSEAQEHRGEASKLLTQACQNQQLVKKGLALLDPILILFTLDCTLSASGRWSSHITRVRSILEESGGPSALTTQRARAQVAMMMWWDATLALVSRQGTILSRAYLDYLQRYEKEDQWSFYQLSGCPTDLVAHIFSLAELAHQRELASTMAWLTFDLTPIVQIEAQIRHWKHPLYSSHLVELDSDSEDFEDADESSFHAQQDRYHCAEAWRHALLLYIERVFKWERGTPRPRSLSRLVRITLDHVRCCRRTSLTQKQVLLPVFLAASETSSEEMRDIARNYCRWWGDRSRYHMFHSVPGLLEEIWSGDYWWGSVVDSKTRGTVGHIPVEFLLG